MVPLGDYRLITDAITRIKAAGKGLLTNFFLDQAKVSEWIMAGQIYQFSHDSVLLVLHWQPAFETLYFWAPDTISLEAALRSLLEENRDRRFVAHLVLRQTEDAISKTFEQGGLRHYQTLVRMSRVVYNPELSIPEDKNVSFATPGQGRAVSELLHSHFDAVAEQLPNLQEVAQWVEKGTLIIYELEQQIAGFIAFDIVGATLHLRYWFVHPTYRDRKIGSVLFRHFLYAGRNTRRQLFWVVSTNENALKRYRHYGFREEQLFNKVMTNI